MFVSISKKIVTKFFYNMIILRFCKTKAAKEEYYSAKKSIKT